MVRADDARHRVTSALVARPEADLLERTLSQDGGVMAGDHLGPKIVDTLERPVVGD